MLKFVLMHSRKRLLILMTTIKVPAFIKKNSINVDFIKKDNSVPYNSGIVRMNIPKMLSISSHSEVIVLHFLFKWSSIVSTGNNKNQKSEKHSIRSKCVVKFK